MTLDEWRRFWETDTRLRYAAVGLCLVLPLLAAALLYAPFLHQWFVSDDFVWIEAASTPNVFHFARGALSPQGPTPYWRPLTDTYFFSMYRVFGLDGAAYHIVSLLIHGAVAAGTILLVWRVSRSLATGLLGGMLFAMTPAYGIAVTWASSITELLSAFLSVATVLLYLWYLDADRRVVLVLSLCTFVAALLAHENAAAVPAILIALGLALRTPRSRVELEPLALSWLPFIGVGVVFAVGQVSRLYVGSKGSYLSWQAGGRLLARMRWLGLPLSSSHGAWLHGGQWALLVVFTVAACVAVGRRSWELPAFFACTVLALLPSGVLSFSFDPRWTYFANVFWAAFVAILIASILRWLWSYNCLLAAAALIATVGFLVTVFAPQTRDAQRGLPRTAAQMEDISRAIQAQCLSLGPGHTAFFFSPIVDADSDYKVSSLVRLLRPGTKVIDESDTSIQPVVGDCLISWSYSSFQVTEVRPSS